MRVFQSPHYVARIKTAALVLAVSACIWMPETVSHGVLAMLHLLAELLHLVYELVAFSIEELLHHSLGLEKFHSQMLVFYAAWLGVAGLAYHLLRKAPMMGIYLRRQILCLKISFIRYWLSLHGWQKIKWVATQSAAGLLVLWWLLA